MSGLEIRGVSRRFGGLKALSNVDADIPDGRITALIGPNGAGKTTLFNVVSGFVRPDVGTVSVAGKVVRPRRPVEVARLGVARTFQHPRLVLDLTLRDNISLGVRRGAVPLEEVADILKLREFLDAFPDEAPYAATKMAEIARSVMSKPELLLLDEPAAGLNDSETASLRRALIELQSSWITSIFLIEHDMKFVMNIADGVIVLDHGVVIAVGDPAAIRADPVVIEAYLGRRQTND
jgi:branched-chain amino acid transport system ATP-binding protein